MASNQPNKGRWGSFLSGAVAGLESRLDTILTDDPEASAKSRSADQLLKDAKAKQSKDEALLQIPANGIARSPSKSRPNERLQERLAKAMVSKAGSQANSEVSSPTIAASSAGGLDSPRTSLDSRQSVEISRAVASAAVQSDKAESLSPDTALGDEPDSSAGADASGVLQMSALPINPARHSEDTNGAAVTAAEDLYAIDVSKSSMESDGAYKSAAELHAELVQMRMEKEESDKQKQEDMDTVLERIDALQAKLQYLAKETVAAAKEANASAEKGSLDQKLAEKDERIALLMEEGTSLSKTEMRHLSNVRKLNAKITVEEKTSAGLRKEVARLKKSESELRLRVARLEQGSKDDATRFAKLSRAESDLSSVRLELSSKEATIADLKRRLQESEKRMETMENATGKSSLVADTRRIGDLEEELANAKIEKKLAEDRIRSENQRLRREAEQERDRAQASELELKTEITNLEARMEALRLRAEEASSDQTGDSQAKLLRQIETLQTQYSLAAENWRTIEGSLNARLTAIEKERDETIKREADVRRKARDLGLKCRRLEEELDSGTDKSSGLSTELADQKALVKKLEARLEASEKAIEDARHDFDQQRQSLEASLSARLEEERSRRASASISASHRSKRTPSPSSIYRKTSAADPIIPNHNRRHPNRIQTNDSTTSLSIFDRPSSRRPSALASDVSRHIQTPDLSSLPTLSMSRKQSAFSLAQLNGSSSQISLPTPTDIPPTPSIHTETANDDGYNFDRPGSAGSGGRAATAADVISANTVHTGPSVQLVERMSSSIRRLEAEKAAHRDELQRLLGQRDEARDQMVALMREAEAKKGEEAEIGRLRGEIGALKERYEACLEMLGEREEEVEELRGDLTEMKRMYRELVDRMGHE